MVSQDVSRQADEITLTVCLVVATLFVVMRTGARWYKVRRMPVEAEDLFMYLALVSFAITCALYLATIPTFFNVAKVQAGLMPPYASLERDLVVMLKEFFVVQFFFWLTLWAVKWSLLFLFRHLTEGLPMYNRIWWAVFVFSVLTFIGACISNFTSCSSMHAWFTAGLCNTPRDSRAKEISLWFSLAADLATDVLIMATPIRVLWHLRISFLEKISIGFIFAVGIITMIAAIIRSVSLESTAGAGQVSTTWLMLWAGVEGAVAIIVGCLPSFAIFIRGRVSASRAAHYNGSSGKASSGGGYQGHSRTRSRGLAGSFRLQEESQGSGPFHSHTHSRDGASDKSLVDGGIMVTQSWSQDWQNAGGFRGGQRGLRPDPTGHELKVMGG